MVALILAFVVSAEDPVADKLNAAREAHLEELRALKEPTLKWFTKQEAIVKRGGEKTALKDFDDSKSLFEKNKELPPGLPSNLQRKYTAAAAALEKSYQTALREYKQAKNLPKAAEVDKEWLEFRIDGPGNAPPDIRDGMVCLIIACCSKMALTVDATEKPAGAFVIQRPPDESDELQHWVVRQKGKGANSSVALQHRKYQRYINVYGGSRGNGAEMILYSTNGRGDNEHWLLTRRGNWLNLTCVSSRLSLAVPQSNQRSGSRIVQWEASHADDQRFKLLPLRTPPK